MKKMKVTFVVAGMALIAATSLTACDMLSFFTPKGPMIEKVSTAFSQEISSGAMQLDAKIEVVAKEGGIKQRVALELNGVENVKSKTADFTMKLMENNNQANAVYMDVYMRGEDVYTTEEYSKGEEAFGLIPMTATDDLLEGYLPGLDIDFGTDMGQSANVTSDIHSFLSFGEAYNAIGTMWNDLTFDVNELIYNIMTSLKPAYERIDENTKVREYFEEDSVKKLINALAGDDTALEMYNDLMAGGASSALSEYVDLLEDFEPEKNQSLYEYVLYLLDLEAFVEETEYASLAKQGQSLGDLGIYEILSTQGNAEEILSEMRDSLGMATKEKAKIVTFEDSTNAYVSLENMSITFKLSGDKAKGVDVKGKIEIGARGRDNVNRGVEVALDFGVEYLEKEKQLRDLEKMDYVKEGFFVTEDPYGQIEYLAPAIKANIRSVIKDKKIEGIIIKYEGQEQEAVYKSELGAYAYTIGGYDMLVEAENLPSTENHGNHQIRYVISFNDNQRTPFNIFKDNFSSATMGPYYVSNKVYGKTEEELATPVDGVTYKLNYDGKSYVVAGLADQNKKAIEIKSEVNGLPVKFIEAEAFTNANVESVKIPSSIIAMEGAFVSCTKLRSVEAHCAVIDTEAFVGCSNLETINLVGVTRINRSAFSGLENLKNVSFGKGLFLVESSAFSGCKNAQMTIPKTLKSIGEKAFKGCNGIKEADLTNVQVLGEYAFNDCKGMEKATLSRYIDDAEDVFIGCTSLEEVVIPNGIKIIGDNCFQSCTSLKKITWSNNLTVIGPYAFSGCSALKEVALPESLVRIDHEAFSNCINLQSITVPRNVHNLEFGAFMNSGVQSVVILSENLRTIASSAFSGCSDLQEVTLPDSIQEIGNEAFLECVSLQNIVMPKNLSEIGRSAFENSGLKSINIPSKVQTIKDYAFSNTPLRSIVIPEGIKEIGFGIVSYCAEITQIVLPNSLKELPGGLYMYCPSITEFTLPQGITDIPSYAFAGCTQLKHIVLPETITAIGWYAFEGCTGLQEIVIPNAVTYISEGAFVNCTSLSSVILPESALELSSDVFLGCKNLKSIKFPSTIVAISYTAFAETGLTEVTIPFSLKYSSLSIFKNCKDLTKVVFAEGVTQITDNLFGGCTSLKTVTIPKTVKKVNAKLFRGATLEEIIYQGTMAEWRDLVWDTGWDREIVSKTNGKAVVKITCTDGVIQHMVS